METLPGVTILSEYTQLVKIPYGNFNWNINSISFEVLAIIFLIGAVIVACYLDFKKHRPRLAFLSQIICTIIAILFCGSGFFYGYNWKDVEQTTYTITIDETTPYLPLTKNYEFIKEENGVYTFKTIIDNEE